MAFGTTIQIFLPDGNPRSIKLAEITSRTLIATLVPRAKLDVAASRQELKRCGVYMLFGPAEDDSKQRVYIGEAEDVFTRLKQHNRAKDFWSTSIAITSKTQHLTKTHIKFLEWLCYEKAESGARAVLENNQVPSKPYVSEPMEADLQENFETIKLLTSTFGYPIFEQVERPKRKKLIYCEGASCKATGEYIEDGLMVFAGSYTRLNTVKSAKNHVRNARQILIDDGTLQKDGARYVFSKNHVFSSPSRAAAVVLAREANGWIEWKYEDGRTLDAVHRQQ